MTETARDRLVRLLGMIAYLEAHGTTSFEVLAEHFGVSRARIEKDLWTLTTSGVPPYLPDECIEFDFDDLEAGQATLVESQGASQVRLSGREAVALIGALATLVSAGTAPPGAAGVLSKIQKAFGGPAPVEVVGELAPADAEVVETIQASIAGRYAVEISYTDAQDRLTERVIEPHRLVAIDGVGYVECYCLKADDYRTLRLDRIGNAAATDVMITHPANASQGFVLEAQFEASLSIKRGARWAFEDIVGVNITDHGELATVTFGVTNVEWAASRVLSVAPHVMSIAPQQLRDAVATAADAVASAHSV